jgi:hypothetical protein
MHETLFKFLSVNHAKNSRDFFMAALIVNFHCHDEDDLKEFMDNNGMRYDNIIWYDDESLEKIRIGLKSLVDEHSFIVNECDKTIPDEWYLIEIIKMLLEFSNSSLSGLWCDLPSYK